MLLLQIGQDPQVFALFRLIPPPGLIGPASVDLTGVVTVGLQIVVVFAWVLVRTTEPRSPSLVR